MYFLLNLSYYVKAIGIFCQILAFFILSFNIRKRHKIVGKFSTSELSVKNLTGVEKHPPVPLGLRAFKLGKLCPGLGILFRFSDPGA